MENYKIIKFNDHLYCINDENLCSVYLIIGSQKAMVIDTGMPDNRSIKKEILKITNKELVVVLTHGHYDHTGHIKEFNHVFMGLEDLECFDKQIDNQSYISNILPLNHEMIFDLGNIQIKAIRTPGHTQGGYTFINKQDKCLFTGDQFGSGCGVWMQVSEASPLTEYIQSIDNFINYLKNNYSIPLDDWSYYGGHLGQEKTSRFGLNPLNSKLVINLKELSKLLLENKVELEPSNAMSFTGEPSYYTFFKTAEMVLRKSIIK